MVYCVCFLLVEIKRKQKEENSYTFLGSMKLNTIGKNERIMHHLIQPRVLADT